MIFASNIEVIAVISLVADGRGDFDFEVSRGVFVGEGAEDGIAIIVIAGIRKGEFGFAVETDLYLGGADLKEVWLVVTFLPNADQAGSDAILWEDGDGDFVG